MIPSGLVTCYLDGIEVRITELAYTAFSIRTSQKLEPVTNIKLHFFHFPKSKYEEITLHSFSLNLERKEEFYLVYTIETKQEDFKNEATAVIKSYSDYIMLKMAGDDGECSKEMVGYPAELDEDYASDFQMQKKEWFGTLIQEGKSDWRADFELALGVDNPLRYSQYRTEKIQGYALLLYKENHLLEHPIVKVPVRRVYLGNQFCHNLFPEFGLLKAMMEQAYSEGLAITIVTTYLREARIAWAEKLIELLVEWCKEKRTRVEIVINDWGMAKLVSKRQEWLIPTLGVLLNKRRKDPRYSYKRGYTQFINQLAENSLNSKEYRRYLETNFGIRRYEYESCGYSLTLPAKNQSLHLPYYQTNTSQYCTLYAQCTQSDRGKQEFVQACPRYCEDYIFSYPKHLKMVGRYNSLFGMDDTILRDRAQLEAALEQGIDRLVLTLL